AVMKREDERAREEFASEAEELLEALSSGIVELEAQGEDVRPELVNKIFREVHSLKGLAGMLGFTDISELSHNLEDMLDRLRMGKIPINRQLIDVLFDAVDTLNRLVIAIHDPQVEELVDLKGLTTRVHQVISIEHAEKQDSLLDSIELDEQTRRSLTEYEEHRLRENVKKSRNIFSIELSFEFATFDEKLRAATSALSDGGEVISTLPAIDPSGAGTGIAFRLLYGTSLGASAVQQKVPEASVSSIRKEAEPRTEAPAPAAQEPPDEELSLRSVSRTVRVDIGKLDAVMNIVGELIVQKTHLETLARAGGSQSERVGFHELTKIGRNLDRKLNDLQRSVIEIRMVPVGQIYTKLARTVRKVARELGKEINLRLRGEETELDKMMVEELSDPLMHIIRNAIDHGIEPKDERIRLGKPPVGNVTLEAYQKGNSVVIDVRDDGRGIDAEAVRRVAVARGLLGPNDSIDQQRAVEILFMPGFSTAASVSEISGRGVGLDVVKKNLQELKGTIEVTSTPGEGTTFRISLPITLAIIQALIVRAGDDAFAIPLTSVEESLRIHPDEIRTVEGREVYNLRENAIPLLRLSDAFGIGAAEREKLFIVVTRAGERQIGLVVDALVRQQEIVIKSIGERLKAIPGIAGATEVGENEIILVIDVGSLIEKFGDAARGRRATVGA
ncbi:MAG TPA: chemotaxis protein CheA, partial [Thermoanaerobaculia bacterium]|nr:chemotaxis protein CheA [Thermoanaerobaculia bacterium]